MTPRMPELLVALEVLELLVFEAAVDAMAFEIPLGSGVVYEEGLVCLSCEFEGLTPDLPVPGAEGGGVVAEDE